MTDTKAKEAHSPGPFIVKGPSKPGSSPRLIEFGGDFAIIDDARHVIGEAFHRVGETDFAPAEANARLWAAAPELLDALERLLASVEAVYCRMTDGVPEDDWRVEVDAARAALAKAKGVA